MQQCPRCSQNVNPGARFCPHCAYDMTQAAQGSGYAPTQVMQSSACPNCGAPVAPNSKFCPVCATPIGAGAGFAGGASSSGDQNYSGPAGYQQGQGYGGYGNQSYPGAGYSTPASRSSKMPLIIGAIVLVLLIGGGVAAYFLWFNKPSAATNSNSAAANTNSVAPEASYSPGESLKRAYSAAEDGDETTFRKLVVQERQNEIPKVLEQMKGEVQRKGKATITVRDEQITGDKATLRCEMKYTDGTTRTMNQRMTKEGGVWKVSDF